MTSSSESGLLYMIFILGASYVFFGTLGCRLWLEQSSLLDRYIHRLKSADFSQLSDVIIRTVKVAECTTYE